MLRSVSAKSLRRRLSTPRVRYSLPAASSILHEFRFGYDFLDEASSAKWDLLNASRSGDVTGVKKHLPDVYCKHTISSCLIEASEGGHKEAVQELLKCKELEVNALDRFNHTALLWACKKGHEEVVRHLLAHPKINVDSCALIWASQEGFDAVVKQLLEREEVDINATNHLGYTALIAASQEGNDGAVKLLLEIGDIDVNLRDHTYGKTALTRACEHGHGKVVALLLDHPDVDPDLAGNWGHTALILATINGHEDVVAELLTHPKTDVNATDQNGLHALDYGCRRGRSHAGIVRMLKQHPEVMNLLPTPESYQEFDDHLVEELQMKNANLSLKLQQSLADCEYLTEQLSNRPAPTPELEMPWIDFVKERKLMEARLKQLDSSLTEALAANKKLKSEVSELLNNQPQPTNLVAEGACPNADGEVKDHDELCKWNKERDELTKLSSAAKDEFWGHLWKSSH